jgi:hypothetical protein
MDRAAEILGHLDALRVELVDLAYALERRGRRDAADVALAVAGRVGEIHAENNLCVPGRGGRGVSAGSAATLGRRVSRARQDASSASLPTPS